ncbi:MAG: tetratricopeptide repeat protein [SAR324 cluster bacterium]|nr:tetratricopeptide repeat protein [SAR324 cluster bacterium]
MLNFRKYSFLAISSFLLLSAVEAQSPQGLPPANFPNQGTDPVKHNPLESCEVPEETAIYQNRQDVFKESIANDSQNPELHYNLGLIQARLQQWEAAQGSFFEALTHHPDAVLTAKIYQDLGNLYACQQQFDQAINQYRQTLRANPDNEEAKYNLALTQKLIQQQKQEQKQQQEEQSKNEQSKEKGEESQEQESSSEQNETAASEENSSESSQKQKSESQKNDSENNQQEDTASKKQDSKEESSSAQNVDEQDKKEAAMQAQLSRQQAEQLLNAIPENRRKFLQRLLQRQTPPPASSGKNW